MAKKKSMNLSTMVIILGGALFVGALAAPSVHHAAPAPAAPAKAAPVKAAAGAADPSPSPKPPERTTLTFPTGQPDAPGRITGTLKVTDSRYGPIVVDDSGYPVYMSDSDGQQPPRSVCYNACTKKWIPLLTNGSVALDNAVPADAVGTLRRWDGGVQLTLRGWPLYLFVNDKQPGDITGHNRVLHWQVLQPDGKPVP
jgi:predicted lipoprotein with Yx(FWY)xxD motif